MARMLQARALGLALITIFAAPAGAQATGTFGPAQVIHEGDDHRQVAAGRFLGGPAVDVVGVAANRGRIDFGVQSAPGVFEPGAVIAGLGNTNAVAAGDFDADGDDDLVVGVSSRVEVWTNSGGSFSRGAAYDTGAPVWISQLLVAPLDADGDLDVVVATAWNSISVLRGAAGATFTRNDYATISAPVSSVAVADFDADGIADIAAGTGSDGDTPNRIEIFHGSPLTNFTRTQVYEDTTGGLTAHNLATADLNADGDPDLVVGHLFTRQVVAYPGAAGDGFGAPVPLASFPGSDVRAVTAGDFDRDGRGDAAAVLGDHTVRVLTSAPGAFGTNTAATYPAGPGVDARMIATADLNADGALDLFTANRGDGISVLLNEVAANLGLALTAAPDPVPAGDDLTYTLTVTNTGPDTAHDVTATLGSRTLAIGTLANGASATRTVTIAAPAEPGVAQETGTVSAREHDPAAANNTRTISTTVTGTAQADLQLGQSDTPDPVAPGALLTYHLTATNHGPTAARDVTITDRLPLGAAYVNAVPSAGGACSMVAGTITCTFASLPASGAATVAVSVRPSAIGSLSNQASVISATPDPGPRPNATTEVTAVTESGGGEPDASAVSITNANIPEGDGGDIEAIFAVSVSPPPARAVTVDYGTFGVTAQEPGDFAGRSGTLVFAAGQTTARFVRVPVHGDRVDEDDETFRVQLFEPVGLTVADATGTATIVDDDDPPAISLGPDPAVREGDADAGTSARIDLSLAPRGEREVRIPYTTTADTATADDFQARSGTVVIPPGQTTGAVTIPLIGDDVYEVGERFYVDFGVPVNATMADRRAEVRVLNDDQYPTLSGVITSAREKPEADAPAELRFRLSPPAAFPMTFEVTTNIGSAGNSQDEFLKTLLDLEDATVAATTTVTLAPGETSFSVPVTVHDDDIDEYMETLTGFAQLVGSDRSPVTAQLRVTSDDGPPTLSGADVTGTEGGDLTVAVALSRPSDRVALTLSTRPGTASSGDFAVRQRAPMTLAADGRSATASVPLAADGRDEGEETFGIDIRPGLPEIEPLSLTGHIIEPAGPPVNVEPPHVVVYDSFLSVSAKCATGVWRNGGAQLDVNWYRNGTPASHGASLSLSANDENTTLTCRERVRNSVGDSEWAMSPGVVFRPSPSGAVAGVQATSGVEIGIRTGAALQLSSGGAAEVPVTCSALVATCAGDVTLRANVPKSRASTAAVAVLGRTKYSLKRGQTKTVNVPVARKRRKLIPKKGLKATLEVRTKSGTTETIVRRSVVLKR
jgi:uncharacterized repeat protein (TIGR01451 family)